MNIFYTISQKKLFKSYFLSKQTKKNPAHAAKISKTKFSVLLLAVLLTTENIL